MFAHCGCALAALALLAGWLPAHAGPISPGCLPDPPAGAARVTRRHARHGHQLRRSHARAGVATRVSGRHRLRHPHAGFRDDRGPASLLGRLHAAPGRPSVQCGLAAGRRELAALRRSHLGRDGRPGRRDGAAHRLRPRTGVHAFVCRVGQWRPQAHPGRPCRVRPTFR